uniref:Uncharacterized protein n=1 Tax=Kwoniella bestiolae CBS 10118 TaxID=1296100 RepID=A0A1B9FXI6_9TREE|nr:hypothetical protein I302_06464 [Kwoniella bestiolae CBS 10118]OCF23482.1 hypothetical protein I302_06464 [Kwoniella bestiolae CBS 10118]
MRPSPLKDKIYKFDVRRPLIPSPSTNQSYAHHAPLGVPPFPSSSPEPQSPSEISPSHPLHSARENDYPPSPICEMGLQPEEVAHVITKLSDSTITVERKGILLKLLGVESTFTEPGKNKESGGTDE